MSAPKMSDMGSVSQTDDGVDVRFQHEAVEREKVDAMLDQCRAGSCDCCGPEFVERLDGLDVEGADGDVTIHVRGPVTKEIIEEKLGACDCYGK